MAENPPTVETKTRGKGHVDPTKPNFPVAEIHERMRIGNLKDKIDSTAPIYLAAVLEYVAHELYELGSNVAREKKAKKIAEEHIVEAIHKDKELKHLFQKCLPDEESHAHYT